MMQNAGITIEWKRKDANKGYAVGVLRLGNASVPVIVNDFKLSPMDVVLISGTTYPLNQNTLQEMLASPEAFQGLASGVGKNLSLFGLTDNSQFTNYGSGMTREGVSYSERPAIKLASVIDQISTVNQEDIDNVLMKVSSSPEILNQFIENGNDDVLDKLANLEGSTPEDFAEGLLRGLKTDRHLVCTDKYGNSILKQANAKIDYV